MILYDLRCATGHGFEGWFRDSAAYDSQSEGGEIACPVCGDTHVEKAPMAPRIGRSGRGERWRDAPEAGEAPTEAPPAAPSRDQRMATLSAEARKHIEEMRRRIETECDYVGDRFAEEARRIHYAEVERRDIYGEATDAEAASLAEEGIAFARIPWPKRTDS